ncbi:MAG: amino acid adenylation domain-containing protein [Acidobacteriota bacterium]|nr:amino acid adenylation domain-containing protein [Acidobacteriota bacterium]
MTELNTLLTSAEYSEHAAFWERALRSLEGDFRLRQPWQSYALPQTGAPIVRELTFDERASSVLNELARGKDEGVFVVILAAVFHVLRIYTGAETIFVDSPCFLKNGGQPCGSVPLIVDYDGSLTVRAYLDRVRDLVAQSYTYQDFPLGEFAETTLKRGLPSTNVLVQLPRIHEPLADARSYDLIISIYRERNISVRLEGRSSVLSAQFLENFGRHLSKAVAEVGHLDTLIGSASVIDEAERNRLVESLAWSRREALGGATVLDLFGERAASAPEQIAILGGEVRLSYAELEDQSSRLAQFLLSEYELQRGDVVGVLAPRSELWVIALLGILKAGAVYLPLDPEYPPERIRFMAEDAGAKSLLIHSDFLPFVTELTGARLFALDLQLEMLAAANQFGSRAAHEDAAYIIYTSGSTGQPKGAVLGHDGLLNMAVHHVESFGFDETDRLTQFYSPCFDGSILEVFVAFLSGATLVLTGPEMIKDPEQFSAYIAAQGVTTVNAPPMYLETLDWEKLPKVRRVISAGDQAKAETARRLMRDRTYNNSYGPTEATVCATNYQADASISYGSRVPVGRPLRNVAVYLLDDELNLVPEGTVGEVCISGVGLARGYLNRDELTAESFVVNPFVPGERLYRTGDLGVWLPDGNLELTGRKDTQVKVRGFRVELGEIESQLLRLGGVKEAVVVVREEQPGGKRLVAFVSPAGAASEETLREHLKAGLPAFMIPSSFVPLDELPLNRNGKIDRQALATMPLNEPGRSSHYAPPETPVQEALARIWGTVLGRESVGIHDNFFELGGDSIMVIQVVSYAHQEGLKLSSQQVFEHPTIAGLSNFALAAERLSAEQGELSGPAPLTPIQRWFFGQPFKSRHHYNQSVMLEVPSALAPELFGQALDLLARHHDALRLRFPESGGFWEQTYAEAEANQPFAVTDLSGLAPSAQDARIEEEAAELQASLDLSSGPIFRAHLFKLGDERPSRLLFIIHHLAVDAVSWRILLEDFYAACRSLQAGVPVQFPPKTSSLRAWAARLLEFSDNDPPDRPYWLNEARRASPRLPTDYEAAPEKNTVATQATVTVELSEQETHNLLQEAPRAFNTQINDILLAALLLTLKEWTGEPRLLVTLEGHGREDLFDDLDISRTVGWFTSAYPLLLEAADDSPTEILKSVKEQIRAVPLRGVGYGIARYLSSDRSYVEELESQPRAEVLFNYLGQIDQLLAAGGDWQLLPEAGGPEHAADEPRGHLLELEGIVHRGRLRMNWKYSRNLHAPSTIERIAGRYAEILRSLVDDCTRAESRGFTPSDFPAARLDQETLDALIARIQG